MFVPCSSVSHNCRPPKTQHQKTPSLEGCSIPFAALSDKPTAAGHSVCFSHHQLRRPVFVHSHVHIFQSLSSRQCNMCRHLSAPQSPARNGENCPRCRCFMAKPNCSGSFANRTTSSAFSKNCANSFSNSLSQGTRLKKRTCSPSLSDATTGKTASRTTRAPRGAIAV